jgi:adenosylmethionine---8-amino-7-oxononanoate aminotransferase
VMQNSYHGDTIGAMSVGARGVFNAAYEPLLFDVVTVPFPHEGQEQVTLDALEAAALHERPAAFIVEPLVLGAGGMLMYPAWVLKEMRQICQAAGVFFIADEVMTGWGRTGTLFACEQAEVSPDIVCYSKGLTGGALPLAVTLCRPDIFDAHFSHDRSRTFFHSSSYTANPIACAAAKANLDLWQDPAVLARVEAVAAMQERALLPFRTDTRFKNVRRTGTITALELDVRDSGYLAGIGPRLLTFFASKGLLLRPLGNTIYVMPPYCITQADLDEIYAAIAEAASL